MADDRYRNDDYGSSFGRSTQDNQWRDERFQREDGRSSARDYAAAGYGDDRNYRGGGTGYDADQRDGGNRGGYGSGRQGGGGYGNGGQSYGNRSYGSGQVYGGKDNGAQPYRGSYASDGHRWSDEDGGGRGRQDYGRQPQGYNQQDRGFFDRAGDEVRSWFGDEDAERRRRMDQRADDDHYHNWRRSQIDALDRDYHEYRQEGAKKFESEFGTWRSARKTQRSSLSKVNEHMDVVGSDGEHVGTVDKVRGDRVILTKDDAEAGGRHHSFPSSWIQSVDDKVTLSKTADQAKSHWRDEERSGAFFQDADQNDEANREGRTNLNRSFSGTY